MANRICLKGVVYNDNFRPISISEVAMFIKNFIVEQLKIQQKFNATLSKFSPVKGCSRLSIIFIPCRSSIRDLSSPQNFLSYAVSIVQKVPSQPKLSRFNL